MRWSLLAVFLVCACALRWQVRAPGLPGTHGLLVLEDGGVWLADSFGRSSPDRAVWNWSAQPPTRVSAAPLPPLAGLTRAPDGGVLACAFNDDAVLRLDDQLRVAARWTVAQPWNVAFTAEGLLAVSSAGSLVRLLDDGGTRPLHTGLDAPFDLAPTDGGVWVSEQVKDPTQPGRVTFFANDGRRVEARYPFLNPEGLALLSQGHVLVADTERRELVLVEADGAARRVALFDSLPVVVRRTPGGAVVSLTGPHSALIDVVLR